MDKIFIKNVIIKQVRRFYTMVFEFVQLFGYSILIVLISKYILVKVLRNIAENLKLKSKTIGNIAGFATSIPELLTVTFSASTGFINTAIYNVLSSNIINFIQYIVTIVINKNQNKLKQKAIKIDVILVLMTILIPILIILFNFNNTLVSVLVFFILFNIFYNVSKNAHELYVNNYEKDIIDKKQKNKKERSRRTLYINIAVLFLSSVILYIIGESLGNTLEILCNILNVPEFILGILLGVTTSIPEFITFFESQKHYKNTETYKGVIEATSNLLFSNMANLFLIQSIGIIVFLIFS